ncbi:hypothetical protein [Chitinophaga nivalis]|uniref:MBL fold metallo-hydrolase n=1 Tax=Chitinophaga nivalis TaxID=2991709 RepID=A0ABT3IHP8_9BACT|nr:hypothetical protein [Chitinophaga nivalis]MCW3466984.1 hypothetical protein [Chitinophaga nivalis]MCW3483325.1 hypothetical protein [Chitinophaga nivalis]
MNCCKKFFGNDDCLPSQEGINENQVITTGKIYGIKRNRNKIYYLLLTGLLICGTIHAQVFKPGDPLPAWKEGYLDLHHINTGKGNAMYAVFPDGTTMLVDAGELFPRDKKTPAGRFTTVKPDTSKKPYEWIVNYIRQVAPVKNQLAIDYAMITHFHDDHYGAWYPEAPWSSSGKFRLTGITGVMDLIPVKTLIDRGHYYPNDIKTVVSRNSSDLTVFENTTKNYFDCITEKIDQGLRVVPLKAGSRQQITLLKKQQAYPQFYVRNVKSSQWIWTGKDTSVVAHFPEPIPADRSTWPDENSLSLAFTINYGPFRYYTGGDNTGNVFKGDSPYRDVETVIATAVGEVDIATMDHHGNRDAVNESMISAFKPRVWIGQTWSADHPGHEVLLRVMNQHIYKGERDVFATNMLEANKLVIGPLIDRAYKSQQGHIVVRVSPGGESYHVIILDDSSAAMPVKAVFGPYTSKKNKG